MELYVCMCCQINTGWVYGLWPFLFKMGSLSNTVHLIQVWYHLSRGSNPAKQHQCLEGQCCPWGWSKQHKYVQLQHVSTALPVES